MKCGTLEKFLTCAFYRYGKFVARYPWPFLVIPIVTSLFLVSGMAVIRSETDSEYIYTPSNGDAKDERTFMQETFTENDIDYFSSSRKTSMDGILQIILHSRNQTSILNFEYVQEIFYVDSFIKNFSATVEKSSFCYNDLCSKWNGSCEINPLLEVLKHDIRNNESLSMINYPVANGFYFIGGLLGGVEIKTNGIVTEAKAVQLIYHLRYLSSCDAKNTDAWLESITNYFVQQNLNLQYLEMSFLTSLSLDMELTKVTDDVTKSFSTLYVAVVILLVAFAIITSLMADCVKSKPVVSLCGLISACLAIASTFGVLPGWNIPYTSTVAGMPFLIIGIGVDDMFVILSAWRHTSPKLSIEERMGQTMKSSAVSITLTSLTDVIAFLIGAITPFRAVIYFCMYTGIAIIFCYIYVITFFTSCLYFSGVREKQNRHSVLCCIKTKDKETDKHKNNANCFYNLCCTGGEHGKTDKPDGDSVDKLQPFVAKFMRKYFSRFILISVVKIGILLSYTAYIGFGIYGCIILEEGLDNKYLANDDSYVVPFYENQRQYFSPGYGPRIMVAVKGNLNYSSITVQNEIQHLLSQFENNMLFDGDHNLTGSWLQKYVNYLEQSNQKPTSLNEFVNLFKEKFTKISCFSQFALDVSFETNSNSIIATRYFVQSIGINSSLQEKQLLLESRDIAKQSSLNVDVFHPVFIYYDQYPIILRTTLQNMSIAVIVLAFVTFIFIPNIGVVLWISFSLISICFGVVGFMALWNVSLNAISMVFIIMCIGFSVDFSAHMVYHIIRSSSTIFSERIKEAMSHIGAPILQGAISSILAIVVLGFSESHIFRSFFKIIFLVMVFGIYHSIFVLPIFLSIQHNISFLIRRKATDKYKVEESKNIGSTCSSIPTISSYENDSNLISLENISRISLSPQCEPVKLLEVNKTTTE